jgi:hypothetical protein
VAAQPILAWDKLDDLMRWPMPLIVAGMVLWFVSVALTGWVASRKGRDDGFWAVVALFIGPIALVAVCLLPRRSTIATPSLPDVTSNDARGGWGEKVN